MDYYDLPPEERAAMANRAYEDTGMEYEDLPPEDRAYYSNTDNFN